MLPSCEVASGIPWCPFHRNDQTTQVSGEGPQVLLVQDERVSVSHCEASVRSRTCGGNITGKYICRRMIGFDQLSSEPGDSDFALGWGLRVRLSNKLPGDGKVVPCSSL